MANIYRARMSKVVNCIFTDGPAVSELLETEKAILRVPFPNPGNERANVHG